MTEVDAAQLKKLKREAAIQARDSEYEIRLKEQTQAKRQELIELKALAEKEAQKRVEDNLARQRQQTANRAQQKARQDALNARRDQQIENKLKRWNEKALDNINRIIQEFKDEEERIQQAMDESRARKRQEHDQQWASQRDKKGHYEVLDNQRDTQEEQRKRARDMKALDRVDVLKLEVQEEVASFIQNPFPTPLRQVLAGRLKMIPTVTQLLAHLKDAKEDLKNLEDQDIPMRATLRKQTLFQYIRDVQLKAEEDRVRPPEPTAGDMGRTRSPTKRGPGSPKPGARKSQSPKSRRGR